MYNLRRKYEILLTIFLLFIAFTIYQLASINQFNRFNSNNNNIIDINRPYFKQNEQIDCNRLFANNHDYISKLVNNRITIESDEKILANDTDNCEAIRSRNYFAKKPLSKIENDFPLAFANIAYRDYLFLERSLSSIYAPQNYYCYILDAKVTEIFRQNMIKLSECFTNVNIVENSLIIDSRGGNMTRAYLSCLRHLLATNNNWKYVLILQNHDFPLRTNREIVEILTELNGTNDVELTETVPHQRIPTNMTLDIYDLQLFNPPLFRQGEANLTLSKGYVQSSLSRAFVEFIINRLNVSTLLNRFDERPRTSELFWATINFDKNLQAPGGISKQCHNYLIDNSPNITKYITRHSVWTYPNRPPTTSIDECKTGRSRHWICTFGVEDLANLKLSRMLFVNKFRPSFDYASAICMHELIFNRTFVNNRMIDKEFYRNTPARFVHQQLLISAKNQSKLNNICAF